MPPKKQAPKPGDFKKLLAQKRKEAEQRQEEKFESYDPLDVVAEYLYMYKQPKSALSDLSHPELVQLVMKGRKFEARKALELVNLIRVAMADKKAASKANKFLKQYEDIANG